jgi:hypothetical protein
VVTPVTDLAAYARFIGAPWPLPPPEDGQPDLLRESLEAAAAGHQAVHRAYGPPLPGMTGT